MRITEFGEFFEKNESKNEIEKEENGWDGGQINRFTFEIINSIICKFSSHNENHHQHRDEEDHQGEEIDPQKSFRIQKGVFRDDDWI